MGIISKIKEKLKKPGITLKPTAEQKSQYRYWKSAIQRARKARPDKEWEAAEGRLKGEYAGEGVKDKPFVNDFRKEHEASMSFLDQQDAGFKITPSEGYMQDEVALGQAQCDAAYLKKVWVEQKCQKAESRKLNDALTKNNGTTLVQFDLKKWMPYLRYLPQGSVLIDPDCEGIVENADWQGYEETVSLETFRSWHPDIKDKVFEEIVKKAGSVLKDDERANVEESDVPLYRTIKVVHIYARNTAAIREEKEPSSDEPEKVDVPLAEEMQLTTPRRYIQFVEGWNSLMVDENEWPFDLDHDEFPPTHLQFNQVNGSTYGFTDFIQMEKLDLMGDDMMRDLAKASFHAGIRKFLGAGNLPVSKEEIDNFLNDTREAFLPDMASATAGGQLAPKILPLDRGQINPSMTEFYKLVQEQVKEASSLVETLSNADAQTFKDVTAIAARIADSNMHQRVNRRLGGPWGYEQSITEDAIKMLEIAHQLVPAVSAVAVMEQMPETDEQGNPVMDEMGQPAMGAEQEVVKDLPWPQAREALKNGGTLIKLGVDALVGQELARFWPYGVTPREWKLNVKVIVEPGTTRAVTSQQQAAVMKQLYIEMFQPFYQMIMQYDPAMGLRFMRDFLEFVGRLAQVPDIEQKLPEMADIQRMIQTYIQQMQQQQQMEQQQYVA